VRTVALGEIVADARPGFASGEDVEDGIVQVRMNNVTVEGAFDWSKLRRVPRPKKLDDLVVKPNDILFNATNSPDLVGKNAVFRGFSEPVTFSNHFIRLRLDDRIADSRLVSRWLSDQWRRGKFRSMCRQWVNQASLNKDQLLSLELPLPPLAEQRRLAAILDQTDDLRRKRWKGLEQIGYLSASTFIEMFEDPAGPTDWPKAELGAISTFENGDRSSNYPAGDDIRESGILFLSTRNIVNDTLDLSVCNYISPTKFASLLRGKAKPRDLIITLRGTLGSCCIFEGEVQEAFINAQMMIIRPGTRLLSPFIHSFLTLPSIKEHLLRIGTGAAVPQLTAGLLSKLVVPVPTLDLQRAFAARVADINKLKVHYRSHLAKLDMLFASLQHRAFRGEL
jgi:type I restriction enzyme S subunit